MKNTFKKTALIIALSLGSLNVHASGIPVIDGAQIGNQIQTWAVEAQRWKKELEQYKQDFQAQQEQILKQNGILDGLTGIRDIAGVVKDVSNELKNVADLNKWLSNTDQIHKYGKDILGGDLRKIFDSYQLTHLCNNLVPTKKKICEGNVIIDVVKQEQNKRDIENVENRVKEINKIAQQMKRAKDQKEATDLSNAMQAQIALLQADKLQLDIKRSNEELAKSKAEKQHEEYIKKINSNFDYSIK